MNVFSSYRARRRLLWIAGFAAIAAIVGIVIVLIPEKAPSVGSNKLSSKPAVIDTGPKPRKLTHADRRAIDRTVDAFVLHAVARKNVAASYDLVTSSLRAGTSRSSWRSGSIPVYPYPAKGRTFHGWTVDYSDTSGAGLQLMLRPRKSATVGPVIFELDLKRAGKRWLVDSFTPTASFAPEGKKAAVTAVADYTSRNAPTGGDKARLSADYAYIPFGIFGLLLATVVGWAIFSRVRARRVLREQRGTTQLPQLPRTR
jgi:hypothetical protein